MNVVELSGGVGGARMAIGLEQLSAVELSIVVNIGDDEEIHGLHVSPDIDTVTYTLAHLQGPDGWGRSEESFRVNTELARFEVDNTFLLGDLDLALNIYRTSRLAAGDALSTITQSVASSFNIVPTLRPASDDRVRTELLVNETEWIGFQEYFVIRRAQDRVDQVRFAGRDSAAPAPGVVESIRRADHVVIAPSNPPLSIWPILSIEGIREAVISHPNVTAVSPLIGGRALKGPADRVLTSLGLPPGNLGVAKAYEGIISRLIVDTGDAGDAALIEDMEVLAFDTKIKEPKEAERLSREILGL